MVILFGAASFVGAALLFLVEPMLAKLVLPAYGGSPTVWNTCTLFFQALLLAGYAYAHFLVRRSSRFEPVIHSALLIVSPAYAVYSRPSNEKRTVRLRSIHSLGCAGSRSLTGSALRRGRCG